MAWIFLSRRKKIRVAKSACLALIELAADVSLFLGIRWAATEASNHSSLAQLSSELSHARKNGDLFCLPAKSDFFEDVEFELLEAQNSCLILMLIFENTSAHVSSSFHDLVRARGMKAIASVDIRLLERIHERVMEAESLAA